MLPPEESQRLIREGVKRDVERRAEIKPYKVSHPVKLEIPFNDVVIAELASYLPAVERPSGNTIVFTGRDMTEVSKFNAVVTSLRSAVNPALGRSQTCDRAPSSRFTIHELAQSLTPHFLDCDGHF